LKYLKKKYINSGIVATVANIVAKPAPNRPNILING
jgi:hypothetical protein